MENGPRENLYIYKVMSRDGGMVLLFKKLNEPSMLKTTLKKSGQVLWVIRESNSGGMLTVDGIFWERDLNEWKGCSTRFALTNTGWFASSDVIDKDLEYIPITAETVGVHTES